MSGQNCPLNLELDLETAIKDAVRRLAEAGVATPRADAELLAAHVLGVGRGEVAAAALRGAVPSEDLAAEFQGLVERRARREPLQHLTGWAAFRGLALHVGPGVFVPRPETEVVAGIAIEEAAQLVDAGEWPVVVDLGTGSGAIAIAVAVEIPRARVTALEVDPGALEWAARNIAELAPGVDLRRGDIAHAARTVLSDLAGGVDVVVANPPYIPPDGEPQDPEVRDHDPVLALYGGGDDGLAVPRAVVATAEELLKPGGLLVMEHADSQPDAARALARPPAWADARTANDLTGRPRALVARRTGAQ